MEESMLRMTDVCARRASTGSHSCISLYRLEIGSSNATAAASRDFHLTPDLIFYIPNPLQLLPAPAATVPSASHETNSTLNSHPREGRHITTTKRCITHPALPVGKVTNEVVNGAEAQAEQAVKRHERDGVCKGRLVNGILAAPLHTLHIAKCALRITTTTSRSTLFRV